MREIVSEYTCLTYGTPCFQGFIKDFDLSGEDYYVISSSARNVVFYDFAYQFMASVYVKGFNCASNHRNKG